MVSDWHVHTHVSITDLFLLWAKPLKQVQTSPHSFLTLVIITGPGSLEICYYINIY